MPGAMDWIRLGSEIGFHLKGQHRMSDDELVFQKVYEAFQPKILRYLKRLAGEEEAEDLTQDVFVKVSRSLGGFRGEAKLSTWLYRIATNAVLDRMRSPSYKRSVKNSLPDVPAGDRAAPFLLLIPCLLYKGTEEYSVELTLCKTVGNKYS
jgi:DNA-directed RNA polymerase specialized sigma24 family protein